MSVSAYKIFSYIPTYIHSLYHLKMNSRDEFGNWKRETANKVFSHIFAVILHRLPNRFQALDLALLSLRLRCLDIVGVRVEIRVYINNSGPSVFLSD